MFKEDAGDAMNEHNTENKPSDPKDALFSCDFANLHRIRRIGYKPANLQDFESWIEEQLEALEAKFAHNITVHSQRADLKSSR